MNHFLVRIMQISILPASPVTASCAEPPSKTELDAAESSFLKSRQAMSEVHCVLRVKTTANAKATNNTYEIWASGDKLRMDLTRKVRITDNGSNVKIEPDENGLLQRSVVCKMSGQVFDGTDDSRSIKHLGPLGGKNKREEFLIHPCLIGCAGVSFGHLYGNSVDMMIRSADRENFRVDSEKIGHIETVRLRWFNKYTAQITTWLDPKQGFFPIQIEARGSKKIPDLANSAYSVCRNIEIAPAKGDGTLFPKRIKYEHYSNNNILNRVEEVVVEEIEIGKKIDPAVFSIAGFDLGDSFTIQDVETKNLTVWNRELKRTEPLPPERMRPYNPEQFQQTTRV